MQGYFHLQKMPELIVPVLNEIFGTNYPLDVPLEQLRNEHQTLNGEKITDSYFRIGKKVIISNARVQVTRKWLSEWWSMILQSALKT